MQRRCFYFFDVTGVGTNKVARKILCNNQTSEKHLVKIKNILIFNYREKYSRSFCATTRRIRLLFIQRKRDLTKL